MQVLLVASFNESTWAGIATWRINNVTETVANFSVRRNPIHHARTHCESFIEHYSKGWNDNWIIAAASPLFSILFAFYFIFLTLLSTIRSISIYHDQLGLKFAL